MNEFWLAVNPDGTAIVSLEKPTREAAMNGDKYWYDDNIILHLSNDMVIPILGHPMTWEDEPVKVELKLKLK